MPGILALAGGLVWLTCWVLAWAPETNNGRLFEGLAALPVVAFILALRHVDAGRGGARKRIVSASFGVAVLGLTLLASNR